MSKSKKSQASKLQDNKGLTSSKKDFSQWYSQVLDKAEVIDLRYGVKGFIVIRPWGTIAIENIYDFFEKTLQEKGHKPTIFPTVIPEKNLKKEAEHVKGFTPEVFWLSSVKGEDKLALRPTSETAFTPMFALWIRSHRDLPLKLYQRCSVFRYDTKATRPLIRGREFYWIEAHDAFYFGIGFWMLMTFLLREGLRGLRKVETWGVLIMITVVLVIFFWLVPSVDLNNINYVASDLESLVFPFGIVLFAIMGFSAIPEIRREIKGSEELFKKSILLGALIPIIIYIIFSFVFVGVLGNSVNEVATLSFDGALGKLVSLLGIFTMFTSYFVLSFALKDIFVYDKHQKKKKVFFNMSILPLIFYLLVVFFGLDNFVKILGIGGVIAGGVTGILVLLMNLEAKNNGNRKPEFSVPINKVIVFILTLIFIIGIVLELFF